MGSEEAVDGTYSVTIVGTELRESAKGKSFTVSVAIAFVVNKDSS